MIKNGMKNHESFCVGWGCRVYKLMRNYTMRSVQPLALTILVGDPISQRLQQLMAGHTIVA